MFKSSLLSSFLQPIRYVQGVKYLTSVTGKHNNNNNNGNYQSADINPKWKINKTIHEIGYVAGIKDRSFKILITSLNIEHILNTPIEPLYRSIHIGDPFTTCFYLSKYANKSASHLSAEMMTILDKQSVFDRNLLTEAARFSSFMQARQENNQMLIPFGKTVIFFLALVNFPCWLFLVPAKWILESIYLDRCFGYERENIVKMFKNL